MSADLPLAAVEAAAEALDAAKCICPKGVNQYGNWYSPSPLCPRCGDSTAKAWVILRAALPHLHRATPYTEQETTNVEERPDDDPAPVATCNGRDCGGRPHA